jgi:transcriptional regulator with XRE-family HTH domain
MATSSVGMEDQNLFGMPDGVTNTHIRKQIQRLRLSKGWTKRDLEQAAHLAPDTLQDFEAGIRRINVDTLRKLIEALESDITEVWPSTEGANRVRNTLSPEEEDDPLNFSRLIEIHSLTGAEASCLFIGDGIPDVTRTADEEKVEGSLRTLAAVNLKPEDRDWLRIKVLHGTTTSPWATFVRYDNGHSMYLCLKNPRLESGAEVLVERCLSAWLAVPVG